MTYQDMRVKGHLTRMSAGTLKMEFTEPATLNGMSMEWDGETISVKYAGLSFGVDPAAVPESALGKGLLDALDAGFRSGGEGQMTDKGRLSPVSRSTASSRCCPIRRPASCCP